MILSTLVTSQLHFEMCAGLYGHPVYLLMHGRQFELHAHRTAASAFIEGSAPLV